MKKGWKCRLLCGVLALAITGMGPMAAYADEESGAGAQETFSEENGPGGTQEEGGAEEKTETSPGQESGSQEGADREQEAGPTMDEQVDAYFDGSVFVGDSVMLGFGNYSMRRGGPYLGRMRFLAAVSFSVFNALRPITAKSTHPVYQGQKRYIWDSLAMMDAKKVFLFFGLNDIDMGPLEATCGRYAQVVANIKATCPDAQIHIISMTYTKKGRGKGRLNNPTIRQFNDMLRQMALDNGWGFVDIANPLADANGDLAAGYCSDNYVHLTTAAYDVWAAVLRQYAQSQIEGTSAFPVGEKKPPEEEPEAIAGGEEDGQGAEEGQGAEGGTPPAETETSPVIGPKEENQTGPGVAGTAANADETESATGTQDGKGGGEADAGTKEAA